MVISKLAFDTKDIKHWNEYGFSVIYINFSVTIMFESSVLNGLTRLSIEIGSSKSRTHDDFIDRINHSYTTVLMICTLVIMGRQFIGKPIACWTPNEFISAQVEYATLVCWVTSTYFISSDQPTIPSDLSLRR
ncbi:unnamed protein product, partial [Schistosoma curassoni]|uniref:Innexin n=1 Tax=Schistosoma curassoni TaxID=6186 RepID=A0A183L192_9TREM